MGRFRFGGGVALVTGGSSGIGAALVRELARKGMRVIATGRRAELVADIEARLNEDVVVKQKGGRVIGLAGDVTDSEHRDEISTLIESEGGCLDLLVNNAGRGYDSELMDGTDESEESLILLNVMAPLRLTRLLRRPLQAACEQGGRGTVVNVSSLVGYVQMSPIAFYSATKAALTSLTDSMRHELRSEGIHVIGCHPGMTATPFNVASERDSGTPVPKMNQGGRSARAQARIVVRAIRWRFWTADPIEKWPMIISAWLFPRTAHRVSARVWPKTHR